MEGNPTPIKEDIMTKIADSKMEIRAREIAVILRALAVLNDTTKLTIDDQTALENVTARLRVIQTKARV
jgi:hypothetical protein